MSAVNPFAGLTLANVSGSGNYLDSDGGEYVLKIDNVIYRDNLQNGGQALIVDFEVIESTNPKDPVGAKRNWFQSKNTSFGGAVLEFLYAILRVDYQVDLKTAEVVKQKSPDLMTAALGGGFNGKLVRCKTRHKMTKVAKKDFTQHTWKPFPDALPKEA